MDKRTQIFAISGGAVVAVVTIAIMIAMARGYVAGAPRRWADTVARDDIEAEVRRVQANPNCRVTAIDIVRDSDGTYAAGAVVERYPNGRIGLYSFLAVKMPGQAWVVDVQPDD